MPPKGGINFIFNKIKLPKFVLKRPQKEAFSMTHSIYEFAVHNPTKPQGWISMTHSNEIKNM